MPPRGLAANLYQHTAAAKDARRIGRRFRAGLGLGGTASEQLGVSRD